MAGSGGHDPGRLPAARRAMGGGGGPRPRQPALRGPASHSSVRTGEFVALSWVADRSASATTALRSATRSAGRRVDPSEHVQRSSADCHGPRGLEGERRTAASPSVAGRRRTVPLERPSRPGQRDVGPRAQSCRHGRRTTALRSAPDGSARSRSASGPAATSSNCLAGVLPPARRRPLGPVTRSCEHLGGGRRSAARRGRHARTPPTRVVCGRGRRTARAVRPAGPRPSDDRGAERVAGTWGTPLDRRATCRADAPVSRHAATAIDLATRRGRRARSPSGSRRAPAATGSPAARAERRRRPGPAAETVGGTRLRGNGAAARGASPRPASRSRRGSGGSSADDVAHARRTANAPAPGIR